MYSRVSRFVALGLLLLNVVGCKIASAVDPSLGIGQDDLKISYIGPDGNTYTDYPNDGVITYISANTGDLNVICTAEEKHFGLGTEWLVTEISQGDEKLFDTLCEIK